MDRIQHNVTPPPPPETGIDRTGTHRPRDISSKGRIVQGTHYPLTHRPRTFVRVHIGRGRIDIAQSDKENMLHFASILFSHDLPVLFRDSCTHSPGRACRRWRGISGCWRSSASAPRSSGWTRTRRWCFLRLVGFQTSSTNKNVAKVWSHWANDVRHFWFPLLLRKYSNGTWCFLRLCWLSMTSPRSSSTNRNVAKVWSIKQLRGRTVSKGRYG